MAFNRTLTEEQIVEILTSCETSTKLGRDLGRDPSTIRNIRNGYSYKDVRPDIPRIKSSEIPSETRFCCDCIHRLNGKCTMGFPESQRNAKFAQVCSIYTKVEINSDWASNFPVAA